MANRMETTDLTEEVQREVVRRTRASLKRLMISFGVRGSVNMVHLNSNEAFKTNLEAQEALRFYHTETSRLHRLTSPHYSIERYQTHRVAQLSRCRRWRTEHPERMKELIKAWYKSHPDAAKELSRRRRARELKAVGEFTETEFRALCVEHSNRCVYCGGLEAKVGKLVPDHMMPLSRGGSNSLDNIAPACRHCNDSKGSKTVDEFLDWLDSLCLSPVGL